MTAPPPPGWYLDDYAQMRWWDGSTWTEHVQRMPMAPMAPIDPRNVRPALTTVAAILAFGGVLSTSVSALLAGVSIAVLSKISAARRALLPNWFDAYMYGAVILYLIIAVLLLLGGLGLIQRRRSGAVLTAVGCVVLVVFRLLDYGAILPALKSAVPTTSATRTGVVIGLALLVFPVVTLCLACGPRTNRWLARTT
ncbi:MAG: DUF2510 domain-containing protein [Nocardiaceae bacterium]|nr:DUF2510 domain-containing protein [Nocardiaceae bacterium]